MTQRQPIRKAIVISIQNIFFRFRFLQRKVYSIPLRNGVKKRHSRKGEANIFLQLINSCVYANLTWTLLHLILDIF